MTRTRVLTGAAPAFQHPLAFLLSAATIYAIEFAVVRRIPELADGAAMAWAVIADLVLLVPLLYYLMLVRGRGWPVFTVVPVFLLSLAGAGWVLPDDHHGALRTLEWLIIPAELFVVGVIVLKARRLARGLNESSRSDFFDRIRESAQQALGMKVPAEVLAFETAIFYYAFFSWRTTPQIPAGAASFSHHRKVLYGTVCAGLSLAVLVEVVPVHLLLDLWSPVAAWIATALSLYSLIWLCGDYRALVLRPTLIADGVLRLRVGLRWNADIPLTAIRRVRKLAARDPEPSQGYLSATVLGRAGTIIEIEQPITVRGVYGLRQKVDKIGVTVDDEAAFEQALS